MSCSDASALIPSTPEELAECLEEARRRTLLLSEDLLQEGFYVPQEEILNPILWEIGHVGWFQERWLLRREGQPSRLDVADALWDSSAVHHDTRWDLPLPGPREVFAYMQGILEDSLAILLGHEPSAEDFYFHRLALFHEDMHGEALAMMRQELDHDVPIDALEPPAETEPLTGDVELPGGTFLLGAHRPRGSRFVFDNEQWAHEVRLTPFALARAPVTQLDYVEFVEDDGYQRDELWEGAGLAWRQEKEASAPKTWRKLDGTWHQHVFGRWMELGQRSPMIHVNAFEANAYCKWAGRRLPTEAEWEFAARGGPEDRCYPWGDADPEDRHAHLDFHADRPTVVDDKEEGDCPHGLRGLIGNVWEWTSTPFQPYPGFEPGPYADYSRPWFGDHVVLRGGSFVTRRRLIGNTWRNFYRPYRQDPFAGFRTARDIEP